MSPINTNPYISTFSGERLPLTRLVQPSQISIVDISQSLSLQCRFNGHTTHHYSVASHCVNCVEAARVHFGITDPHFLLRLLLHDAAEAYMGDIIRPIKTLIPRATGFGVFSYEAHLDRVITQAFILKEMTTVFVSKNQPSPLVEPCYHIYGVDDMIKVIDDRMCFTESTILGPEACPPNDMFGVPHSLYPMTNPGESPQEADCEFIGLTEELHWRESREAFCGEYQKIVEEICDTSLGVDTDSLLP